MNQLGSLRQQNDHAVPPTIDPGSPWQNAWIESFNGRLRDELLNSWRCDYTAERQQTAHGDLTPTEFALRWNQINKPRAA